MYRLWLSRNVKNSLISQLQNFGISAAEAYEMSEAGWKRLEGIKETDLEKIQESKRKYHPEAEWSRLQEKAIGFVTMEDAGYPARLRPLYQAPYALYYIGNLPADENPSVAIVGSRGRSAYGEHVTRELSEALGQAGIDIISGMALGVDSDAHKGSLAGGGRTYAVLGCGVDICYPRQNRYLYEQIRQEGGILSEYEPGTQPIARLFPSRNRIIAGLADKVIVIEAKEKSGSLITADFAMEQGRDVYAVPGRITDPLSQGCNRLIRQGAGALISVEDFMKELKLETGILSTQLDFRRELLSAAEIPLYDAIGYDPISLSLLMTRLELPLPELLGLLDSLKEKAFIRECAPNYYVRD